MKLIERNEAWTLAEVEEKPNGTIIIDQGSDIVALTKAQAIQLRDWLNANLETK